MWVEIVAEITINDIMRWFAYVRKVCSMKSPHMLEQFQFFCQP